MNTKALYLDDFDVVDCQATVVSVKTVQGQKMAVLDQTCFYPKGGGQDCDTGVIEGPDGSMKVFRVQREAGEIRHIGEISGRLQPSDAVACRVDHKRRGLNTRLHSAGHCIDIAVDKLRPDWVPVKAAHFPDFSFVDYEGGFKPEEAEALRQALQEVLDEITARKTTNTIRVVSYDELSGLVRHVPEFLKGRDDIRVVFYDDFGIPCGGTHVKSLDEIGSVKITKIKRKNRAIHIGYKLL